MNPHKPDHHSLHGSTFGTHPKAQKWQHVSFRYGSALSLNHILNTRLSLKHIKMLTWKHLFFNSVVGSGGIWTLNISIGNTKRLQLGYKALGTDVQKTKETNYQTTQWTEFYIVLYTKNKFIPFTWIIEMPSKHNLNSHMIQTQIQTILNLHINIYKKIKKNYVRSPNNKSTMTPTSYTKMHPTYYMLSFC